MKWEIPIDPDKLSCQHHSVFFSQFSMKKLLALSSLLAITLAACTPASGETIKIGYLGPLTGDAAAYGVDTLNGVRMKVDEINAAGGINGKQIEIVAEDGRCNGTDSSSAAQKLVHVDKVVAIIGGQCSGETLAAAPIAEAAGIVMISALSSSPDVTTAGDFIFRDYPSDALKTTAMAGYFETEGVTKIAMITENTDFATGFRTSLIADLGEDMIVFDEIVDPGTQDFRTLLTRLQGTEFDYFFPNGQTPPAIAAMAQQFRELGFTQPMISHDVGDSITLVEIAGDAVDGFRAISVPNAGEGEPFETAFTAKYGSPQQSLGFSAHAYDALGVLAQAIGAAGTEGTAIRDYLYALEGYEGIVGNFHFDDNGDVVGVPYVLREVQNGTFVTVADIAVAPR
jgi:branched-chain amino acid transport system substrate-binding protein